MKKEAGLAGKFPDSPAEAKMRSAVKVPGADVFDEPWNDQ